MGRRTLHRMTSADEARVVTGAWAAHPQIGTEIAGHIIFGTEGRNAEPHALGLARYDFEGDQLSELKSKLSVDQQVNIAVHPRGEGVVASFQSGCKLFRWEAIPQTAKIKSTKGVDLDLRPADTALGGLESVGPQNCLLFNSDGSLLAAGGKDGTVMVFKWPSMDVVLNVPKATKSVRDMDFSLDSAFLSVTADHSPCRIWNLSTAENVANLEPLAGESFDFSRFSRHEKMAFLFVSMTREKKGYIAVWDMLNWSRIGAKRYSPEPITALSITHHGRRLAIGTKVGHICTIETKKMQVEQIFEKVHTRSVTALEFSYNDKALLSLSSDYSSQVSALDLSKEWKEWQISLLLIGFVLLSVAVFYFGNRYLGESFFYPQGKKRHFSRPSASSFSSSEGLASNNHHEEL